MKLIKLFLIFILSSFLFLNCSAQSNDKVENWNFYITEYDDILVSNFVDLELIKIAPIKNADQLLSIKIKLKSPQEDGLSINEEFDELNQLEDQLLEILLDKNKLYYAGRSTGNGSRNFNFYTDSAFDFELNKKKLTSKIQNYPLEISLKSDKEWNHYLNNLFPNEKEMQTIQNLELITYIEEKGDDLSKEREVFHWLYFNSKVDQTNFINKIKTSGFKIINKGFDKDLDEFKYYLNISRSDYIDWKSINDITNYLIDLANTYNGEYDGWETSIEK